MNTISFFYAFISEMPQYGLAQKWQHHGHRKKYCHLSFLN